MSIFQRRPHVTRVQLRQELRSASPSIPGSNKMFSRQERAKLEKEVFGKKWGSHITKSEFGKRLLQLRGEKFRAKTSDRKIEIDRQMRYMKKLGGI